jgi:pyruvate dehydrogenase E1 component beta subunit
VLESVARTGRVLAVDDDYLSYGVTSEILATVGEQAFRHLKCAPRRIAYPDIPPPFARPMEQFALPNAARIVECAKQMLA